VPSETFTHTAVAQAPTDSVWAALDLPSTWESIGGIDKVVDPIVDSDGRLQGFSFDSIVAGKSYRGEATPAGRDEGRLIGWDIQNSEIAGTITVVLSPDAEETNINVTLGVESRGLLSGMFFSVVSKTIGSGLPRSVDEFAAGF